MNIEETLLRIEADIKAIHEVFGFQENWRKYPLRNMTLEWFIATASAVCIFEAGCEITADMIAKGDKIYSSNILATYQAPGYTAFVVDTQCDGNIFFEVYRDELKILDPELVNAYEENWG
jgi:hypothetical protein